MTMTLIRLTVLFGFLTAAAVPGLAQDRETYADSSMHRADFAWKRIAELPDTLGLSGVCAGVSNGALIVAGGTNFPVPLAEGGEKAWYRQVSVLAPAGQEENGDLSGRDGLSGQEDLFGREYEWQGAGTLDPMPSYAAAVTTERGVACLGGSDGQRHYAAAFLLQWTGREVERIPLPSLPQPVAYHAAALVDGVIYVAGGQRSPEAQEASRHFWRLDLAAERLQWEALPTWPGPARILPVAGGLEGAFYLFSGAELVPDGGAGRRRYLRDAYRYVPGEGWEELAALPRPAVAAPSPAVNYGQSHLLVLGGDSGRSVGDTSAAGTRHPGFAHDILAYHTITDTWARAGTMPFAQVTVPAVQWEGAIVVPGGEVRPGVRTPAVYAGRPEAEVGPFGALNYSMLGLYFAVLVGIGLFFAGRERDTDDYFLAGGRIPWWAAGISIFGSQLSAITFMAIPAKAYATDWVYILGQASIVLVAPIVVYFYLPVFRRLQVTTVYEYLERRFDVLVRIVSSMAFILLQVGRMAIVIFLPALALSAATGLDIYLTILLMGLLSTAYTVLGGIEAVIWSDVLQVAVLLGGAIVSLWIIAGEVDGGFSGMVATAAAQSKFHTFTWTWDHTQTAVWVVLFGNLLANLIPFTADQTVVQRYLTTRDEEEAARSVWTNAALTVPAALLFFGLGTALFVFYAEFPQQLDPALQTDAIFPLFIVEQLPDGVAGLLIAGIFAAAMSSLDSSMNSVATVVVHDYYRRFVPASTETARFRLAQGVTVLLGVLATGTGLVMATYPIQSLFDVFLELIGLVGGGLAGLVALGLFTRRAHARGALIGALVSAVVLYLVKTFTETHFFLYGALGIVTCFFVGYVASLILPAHGGRKGMTYFDVSEAGPQAALALADDGTEHAGGSRAGDGESPTVPVDAARDR